MRDPLDLLRAVSGYVRRDHVTARPNRLATVDPAYATGSPKVTFDGESTLTGKGYARSADYAPVAGDRVLMIPAGSSYVILCKVLP